MTNAIYQATVEALEAYMSPRVVSRSLQEGLRLVGKSPADLAYADVAKMLKEHIYRQLQVTMPVTEAKQRIQEILEQLKTLDAGAAKPQEPAQPDYTLDQQERLLGTFKEELKPFNLFFEWSEVQKLRAQLQLLQTEQAAGRLAMRLVQDARAQLAAIKQKLEDQLVNQARDLSELETSLEVVRSLGGAKVRRLESLIGQIKEAQAGRQIAPAEVERALKIVATLRKLMESSVVADAEPAVTDTGTVLPSVQMPPDPEVSAKLLQIDLENERHALEALASEHAHLLAYRPKISEHLAGLRARLETQVSVAEPLEVLREKLPAAARAERERLTQELRALQQELPNLDAVDTGELSQSLQVTLSVLETALPPLSDVQHLRGLHGLAQQQQAELAEQQAAQSEAQTARLQEQEQALASLSATLQRYQEQPRLVLEVESLHGLFTQLQAAHGAGQLEPEVLAEARLAATQLETAAARQAEAEGERNAAQLRSILGEVQSLPSEPSTQAAKEALVSKLEQTVQGQPGQAAIEEARAELSSLRTTLHHAYQTHLERLTEQAEKLNAKVLVEHLYTVSAGLAQGAYPDLGDLERSLDIATKSQRTEQFRELHDLEQALAPYQGATLDDLAALQRTVAAARTRLENGETLELDALWAQLEGVQADLEERTANFEPRLDAALATFKEVSVLNTEESTQVGRILRHLDTQRDALERVSVAMRSELGTSLIQAETLLTELKTQFEATRGVAEQLADSSALEGLFDLFGDGGGLFSDAPAPATLDFGTAKPSASGGEGLNGWLDGYLNEPGVQGLLLFTATGEVVSGQLDVSAAELHTALGTLAHTATELGQNLTLGEPALVVVETQTTAIVSAVPSPGYRLAVRVEAAALDDLLPRLKSELAQLRDLLVHA